MFTEAQMEKYREGVEFYTSEGEEVVPPRTFNIDDYPNYPVRGPEFGDGTILVLGVVDQSLADCECGNEHTIYMPIREDGLVGGAVTSNSVGEVMALHPEVNPLMLMVGAVDPDELGKGIAPTWDAMQAVTPDEWPEQEVKTDMTEFKF